MKACIIAMSEEPHNGTIKNWNLGFEEGQRRLMNVIASGRIDLEPLITHRFGLEQIEEAYELFANQRDGVLKVAITP